MLGRLEKHLSVISRSIYNFNDMDQAKFLRILNHYNGFEVVELLDEKGFNIFSDLIKKKWENNMLKFKDITRKEIENWSIKKYHQYCDDKEHKMMWPKKSRILNKPDLRIIQSTCIFNNIKKIFGDFIISDEENLGYGNLYWRLVRPGKSDDVGPAHRDEWFWLLNKNYKMPENCVRYKVWIPIHTEEGKSGLMVEKKSQKRLDIEWDGELRDGIKKPVLLTNVNDLDLELIDIKKKEGIIFHDKLLHAGMINQGVDTRVSLEFTIIVHESKVAEGKM